MNNKPIPLMHIVLTMEAGGLETVVFDLCRGSDKQLFCPEILCLQKCDDRYAERLFAEHIPVTVIKKKHKFDLGYFLRVAGFLRGRKVKIVHAHSGCFFYAAIFVLLARIPRFVYTAHGLSILNRLQDKIEDNLAGLVCDKILAVSAEIAQHLKERMPFSKKKIEPLINGIDTKKFKPFRSETEKVKVLRQCQIPGNSFLIGAVGRLAPEKNYQMLLQAFARFNELTPEKTKHLVFIGDGSQRKNLELLSYKLGLSELVSFLGNQYNISKILPMLDLFVLSSFTEGTSISLLEAQACGIPAVVTRVGGNPEIIKDGVNGFLVEVGDSTCMAERFYEIIDDLELKNTFIKNSIAQVLEKYNIKSVLYKYEEIYINFSL